MRSPPAAQLQAREQIEPPVWRWFEMDPRGAVAVYLFGSRARLDARPDSDVDVAVLFERDPAARFEELPLGLEADLGKELGLPVQIVALNAAPAELVHRVLGEGRLLLDRAPSRRIAFEVRRRNEYFDLQPILLEYRRAGRPG